jgi:hypothetical protein
MASRLFEFTLWLEPNAVDLITRTNALHGAGVDDCSPGEHCGQPYTAFHREADTFEAAMRSAVRDLQSLGYRVLRCEIDEQQLAAY